MRRRDFPRFLAAAGIGTATGSKSSPAYAEAGASTPFYPLSPEEKGAGVTPRNYHISAPHPERYGAVGDGDINDQTALANCMAANNCIQMTPGKRYLINGLKVTRAYATIRGMAGSGLVIADGPGNFGLHFVSPAGNRSTSTPALSAGISRSPASPAPRSSREYSRTMPN